MMQEVMKQGIDKIAFYLHVGLLLRTTRDADGKVIINPLMVEDE